MRPLLIRTLVLVAGLAIVQLLVPVMKSSTLLWLALVAFAGTGIVWHGAKQLYTAMHGYVVTGMPERKVFREENFSLFRNNVIAWIALFPIIASGAVVMLFEALKAQGLIR